MNHQPQRLSKQIRDRDQKTELNPALQQSNIKQKETLDKFEEYKLFVEDTAHIADRRQLVTSTYITVNGAIVGLITFVSKDIELTNWHTLIITTPLILSGIIVCLFWYRLLVSYEKLVGFRYEQLKIMEGKMHNSHKMFSLQYAHHRDVHPKNRIGQTRLEKQLPLLFTGIYLLIALAIIILIL